MERLRRLRGTPGSGVDLGSREGVLEAKSTKEQGGVSSYLLRWLQVLGAANTPLCPLSLGCPHCSVTPVLLFSPD